MEDNVKNSRILWIDLLRIIACVMVIVVHASSNYVFNFQSSNDHFWGNVYGSFARACVPLFVVISGILLLPLKLNSTDFIKRRFTRVLFPFIIWSLVYVIINYISKGNNIHSLINDLVKLPFHFPENGLHLWYLYVLLGLYLLMPVISPWIANVSKRDELIFIGIWGFTMLIPFIGKVFPQPFGEASWNDFGTFYYFSGYIGYLVLGHFLNKYSLPKRNISIIAGIILFIAVYLLTFGGQQYIYTHKGGFSYQIWGFTTINVALMVVAILLIFKDIQIKNQLLRKIIIELSEMSFGIFLVHYFIVYQINAFILPMGISPGVIIPLNTIVTFVVSYLLVKLISYILMKKYIIG